MTDSEKDMNVSKNQVDIFLDEQIKKINRQKNGVIFFGLLMFFILISYFLFLSKSIGERLTNETISQIGAHEISRIIEEKTPYVEKSIIQKIPLLMRNLKKKIHHKVQGHRVQLNQIFIHSLNVIFCEVDRYLKEELSDKGSEYRIKIAEQLEIMSNEDEARKVFENIDIVLKEVIFDEIDRELDFVYNQMISLEQKLETLADKKQLNEKDKQLVLFILYWNDFFQNNMEELSMNHFQKAG